MLAGRLAAATWNRDETLLFARRINIGSQCIVLLCLRADGPTIAVGTFPHRFGHRHRRMDAYGRGCRTAMEPNCAWRQGSLLSLSPGTWVIQPSSLTAGSVCDLPA